MLASIQVNESDPLLKEIKSMSGIHDTREVMVAAVAVYHTLLSMSDDNVVGFIQDGKHYYLGLTPDADRILNEREQRNGTGANVTGSA